LVDYELFANITNETYVLDGRPAQVLNGSITLERLSLGEHNLEIIAYGVNYSNYSDSVRFEIIPLSLTGDQTYGTPDYPDEVALSFIGRSSNYTLSFEAISMENLGVYVNKHLNGTIGDNPNIVDHALNG